MPSNSNPLYTHHTNTAIYIFIQYLCGAIKFIEL
jgi:hypothetical protein